MRISELVEKLEDIRAKEGDIGVAFVTPDRRWITPALDVAHEYKESVLLIAHEAEKGGIL